MYVYAPWWTAAVFLSLVLVSWRTFRGALSFGALLLAALVLVEPGRFLTVAFAFSLVLVFAGAGRKVLRLISGLPESRALRLAWSFALGHGILSTALAFLGSFSLLGGLVPLGLIVLAAALSSREIRETLREGASSLRGWDGLERAERFALGACALVFLASLGLTFLPHVHSAVADYDVLEYHLGLAREFISEGRVAFFEHNFFSGMPLLGESGYLYCVALVPDAMRAASAARLLNLAALTAVALSCGASGGIWAGAMAFAALATLDLSARAMVEPFWMMNAACAVSALLCGNSLAAGAFSGLCAAVKYPALACGTVPLAAAALVLWAKERRKDLLRFALALAAAYAFWPARSAAVAHNPLFPFGGGRGWTAEKAARLKKGLAPVDVFARRRTYAATMLPAAACFFLPVGAMVLCGKERRVLALAVGGHLAMWFFFTNRIDRFLLPVLPAAAVMAGRGAFRLKRVGAWACAGLLALFLPFELASPFLMRTSARCPQMPLARLTGAVSDEDALLCLSPPYGLVRAVNSLPEGGVLLVGEAEVYYFREGVSYATPFDGDPFLSAVEKTSVAEALRRLVERFDYVAFSWDECERVKRTYGLGPPPERLREAVALLLEGRLVWADGWRELYSLREVKKMRAVVQRVKSASVRTAGHYSEIGGGMLILLGVEKTDGEKEAAWLAKKLSQLRMFEDPAGKMNLSVKDMGGEALVVSQFTLLADCSRGRRPGFDHAAPPKEAEELYETFVGLLRAEGVPVETGVFGARMEVGSVNDGPVTFVIDRPR